jgi:uncharacterized protein YkwD
MRIAVVAAGLVGLVACGPAEGDGDSGVDSTFSTSTWDDAWATAEDEVLELANQRRAIGGRCGTDSFPPSGPLVMDPLLRGLARDFSRRMAEEQFFDHFAPDGSDPFDRMEAAGFAGALPWGENIAAGYPTADQVFAGWMSSPGHCANILEPTYGAIGIGLYERPDDPSGARFYWTQEFAGSGQP